MAQNLLSEDGVIFISIDDNELENLRKICNELFGEQNFIASVIWERAYAPVNLKKHFSECHDYIVCYAKNIESAICNGLRRSDEANERYNNPDNDPRGLWKSSDMSVGPVIQDKVYEVTTPSGRKVLPPEGRCWVISKDKYRELLSDNRIWFGTTGNNVPSIKKFLKEVKNTMTPMTIWKYNEVGHSQDAKQKFMKLFDGKSYFDYPKSVDLIKRVIELYSSERDIILDFFSGSATTAHATVQLNAEEGGNRKFIMVQLPEPSDEKSEAYKAGYQNICEIGKERIRRAGEKIKEENKDKENIESLDIGFRVLKVDDTNMKDVYYSADEYNQDMLDALESNIKEDRTDLDLLYGVLLDWGLPLSLKHAIEEVYGATIHTVDEGSLVACFDGRITEEVVREIAKRQPLRVVFRDSSFADSPDKINVEEIFKLLAPNTTVKVI